VQLDPVFVFVFVLGAGEGLEAPASGRYAAWSLARLSLNTDTWRELEANWVHSRVRSPTSLATLSFFSRHWTPAMFSPGPSRLLTAFQYKAGRFGTRTVVNSRSPGGLPKLWSLRPLGQVSAPSHPSMLSARGPDRGSGGPGISISVKSRKQCLLWGR
jgi:hypothetical protein